MLTSNKYTKALSYVKDTWCLGKVGLAYRIWNTFQVLVVLRCLPLKFSDLSIFNSWDLDESKLAHLFDIVAYVISSNTTSSSTYNTHFFFTNMTTINHNNPVSNTYFLQKVGVAYTNSQPFRLCRVLRHIPAKFSGIFSINSRDLTETKRISTLS